MIRRTTIELDYDLLERARTVLKCDTARATIHEALRRAIDGEDADEDALQPGSAAAVLRYWREFADHGDMDVLLGNEMWR